MNEVHSPKKPLIFYYMVAMLLVMLFNFIAMPWLAQYQIQEVDYNTFVAMAENGEIGRAEIQEAGEPHPLHRQGRKGIYKTAMVPGRQPCPAAAGCRRLHQRRGDRADVPAGETFSAGWPPF